MSVFPINLKKWALYLYVATFYKASTNAINELSLGYLKVNGRGILECVLQAKKKKVKGENAITEICNANIFKAIDKVNWQMLKCITVVPLPVLSSRFSTVPTSFILQESDQSGQSQYSV